MKVSEGHQDAHSQSRRRLSISNPFSALMAPVLSEIEPKCHPFTGVRPGYFKLSCFDSSDKGR